MALAANLQRRVAVYHWRRRLPASWALAIGRTHYSMSLGTREPAEARFLAGQLDASAEMTFMVRSEQAITSEHLSALFRSVLLASRQKFALIADSRRGQAEIDSDAEIEANRSAGWAYRIIASKGIGAKVDARDRLAMQEAGLDETAVYAVEKALVAMQADGIAQPSIARLRAAIRATGARDNAQSIIRASPIYLRAIAEALLESADTYYGDPLPFADLIRPSHDIAPDPKPEHAPATTPGEVPSAEDDTPHAAADIASEKSIGHVAEKLLKNAGQDLKWNEKTRRQASSIFNLLEIFLKEDFGIVDMLRIEQTHLSAFDDLLRIIPRHYGKDGKPIQSISFLRKKSSKLTDNQKGLAIPTRNRHYTFIGVLFQAAKTQGLKLNRDLNVSAFRGQKKVRARDERAIPKQATIADFFNAPVFTGCASWEHPDEEGTEIFHRAAYFGSLLAYYHGIRREEFCGLAVEDVIHEFVTIPYILIKDNSIRTLKNPQSDRFLALHPELIRLGFLDYVKTIRNHKFTHLFPELVSSSSSSPLGDRFYDELLPIFRKIGITAHQMRHFFNNELKQKNVSEEFRADMMGHGGKSETSERYVNQVALQRQKRLLKRIPILTNHLHPAPINLIPWVAEGKPAPWARPNRAKRGRASEPR